MSQGVTVQVGAGNVNSVGTVVIETEITQSQNTSVQGQPTWTPNTIENASSVFSGLQPYQVAGNLTIPFVTGAVGCFVQSPTLLVDTLQFAVGSQTKQYINNYGDYEKRSFDPNNLPANVSFTSGNGTTQTILFGWY